MPKTTTTPGVTLIQRPDASGALVWYGRWTEPASKRRREQRLDRLGVTTAADRERWKRRKHDELRDELRLAALGHVARPMSVADAVDAYLADCDARLRERTRAAYREAVLSLQTWLVAHGRRVIQEIRPVDLMAYRDAAVAQGKRKGSKNSTISTHLARIRPALEFWRSRRLLPHVDRDVIADACKGLRRVKAAVNCLRPAQVRALLEAALELPPYRVLDDRGDVVHLAEPAAFVALALLTGMRLGELEHLQRSEVDTRAAPAGEIRLTPATKTHTARVVDLSVSSTARELLDALLDRAGGDYVLGGPAPLPRHVGPAWKKRLQILPAVRWTWQHLRQSCGTYLVCAPGIWGGNVYRVARQLGHRVQVAEDHYLGVLRGIPAEAATIEAAAECEDVFRAVADRIRTTPERKRPDERS